MEDEDLVELIPLLADKVARRAIVLSVVACRGIVEADRANPQEEAGLAKRARRFL